MVTIIMSCVRRVLPHLAGTVSRKRIPDGMGHNVMLAAVLLTTVLPSWLHDDVAAIVWASDEMVLLVVRERSCLGPSAARVGDNADEHRWCCRLSARAQNAATARLTSAPP